jgi:rsbT antagonist protein RsbS
LSHQIPIIKLGDNLIVSIQTDIDDRTALNLHSALLEKIRKTKATGVMIELTALDMVDSFLGRLISDIAVSSAMMNADTVVVGIQPAVAITLVELGLELGGVHTALNVEYGMQLLKKLKNHRGSLEDSEEK